MKVSYLQNFLTAILLTTGLTIISTPAHAADKQSCNLGATCTLTNQLNAQTNFNVSKNDGIHFSCKIHADHDSLKVYVTDGGDFDIKKGSGYYNANPDTTVDIVGIFNGDNGQINVKNINANSGSITCTAVK